ncbi:hypothetical protein ACHAWU_004390 [Discostella pseudostelligera]|uniref:Peptidase M11 gametolysin domain-containing protein n=1 Tax=Discostella pseudostelligera TaxID=259834 RepID=A0ABD3NC04_9STRA
MEMKMALNDGILISAVSTIAVEKVDVITQTEGGDTMEMEFAMMEEGEEEGAVEEVDGGGGGELTMTIEDIMTASDGGTIEGVTLPPGSIQLYTPTADTIDETNGSLLRGRRRRRRRQRRSLANYTGAKPVLVVRVTDVDGLAPSNDANFISDKIFGTGGDSVTPVSQFALCSYGAYNIVYNDYGTRTAEIVGKLSAPGVLEVTIPISLKNSKKHEVTNAVHTAVATKLGFSAKPGPFAHVVIIVEKCYVDCGWAGYATVNSWLSVFQGKNYMYPAVIMHEFGHNLNFGHSGVGNKAYADHGCLMGNPYYSDDVAGMCFNPAKTYQLIMSNGKNNHKGNWYDVSRVSIWDPSVISGGSMSWTGTLVGVAEYGQISVDGVGDRRLVLRIVSGGTNDMYIGFNRKKGMNKDNKQGSDMVTIIEAKAGAVFSSSIRKAVLKQGQSYLVSNWRGDGSNLEIVVDTIRTDVVPGYATVRAAIVGGDGPATPPTNPPTKSGIQPTPPPTPDTSLSPSFPPVENPTTPIPSFLPPSFPPTPNPTPVPSVSPVVPPTSNPTPEPSPSTALQPATKKLSTIIDSAGKRCKGVIFTVLAKQDVIISSMDVISKMNVLTNVTIYTKTGSYHNGTSPIQTELRADEWQQIYSGTIPFEPYQIVTLDDFSIGVSISAGQIQSFHVLFSLGQLFTVGNALEAPVEVVAEDDSIVIYEGQAMRDVFKGIFGRAKWNGVMRYRII